MSGADAVCMQQPCRSDHSFECALAMARPKARTAIERGLLGGESGYMCTNCISRIPLILLWGVYKVGLIDGCRPTGRADRTRGDLARAHVSWDGSVTHEVVAKSSRTQ